MKLDSGLEFLLDKKVKAVKVENGKLKIGFEDGTVTEIDRETLELKTDGWLI